MTRKTATPQDPKKPASKKRASGTAAPKAKTGRPSSYRAEYAQQVVKLCRLGATDKELAGEPKKYTIDDLKAIKAEYIMKRKEIEA